MAQNTLKGLLEATIVGIVAGHPPPQVAIADPNQGVANPPVFVPTLYEIPDDMPNPPPPKPLRGVPGLKLLLAQCGFNTAKSDAVIDQGFSNPEDFTRLTDDEYDRMASNIGRLPAANGGCNIGMVLLVKLKAMARWCQGELRARRLPIDAYLFTLSILAAHNNQMQADRAEGATAIVPKTPKSFDVHKWITWKEGMWNYFMRVKGVNGIPLAYVVRESQAPATFRNDLEMLIYTAAHNGIQYERDNIQVYQVLHECLGHTVAFTYISTHRGAQDGRGAWMSLCVHYDGPGQVEYRINFANNQIEEAHYRSEAQFTFESYTTVLSNAFGTLEQEGAPKSERDKVKILLDGVKSTNPIVQTAVVQIRMNNQLNATFQIASDKLAELIGSTLPANTTGRKGTPSARRLSAVDGKKSKFKNKKKDKNWNKLITKPDGTQEMNGVTVTPRVQDYARSDWYKIKPLWAEITRLRTEARVAAAATAAAAAAAGAQQPAAALPPPPQQQQQQPPPPNPNNPQGNGQRFGTGAHNN